MFTPTAFEIAMSIGVYITAFLFGITVGSFLNVCIYRLPKGESVIKSNSHCMNCGEAIKKRDLIPIYSWIMLKGKCRGCGSPISPRYMIVEALTGILFAFTFMNHDMFRDGILYSVFLCIFLAFLVEIAFEDFDTKEMSGIVLLLLGGYALFVRLLCALLPNEPPSVLRSRSIPTLEDGLLGVVAVSVPLLLLGFVITPWFYNTFICQERKKLKAARKDMKTARKGQQKRLKKEIAAQIEIIDNLEPVYGFGMGDILLMAAGGLMLGAKAAITAAFAAVLFGAIYSAALIVKRRTSEKKISGDFAFGPFLAAGLAFASFFGTQLFDMYMDSLVLEPPPMIEFDTDFEYNVPIDLNEWDDEWDYDDDYSDEHWDDGEFDFDAFMKTLITDADESLYEHLDDYSDNGLHDGLTDEYSDDGLHDDLTLEE